VLNAVDDQKRGEAKKPLEDYRAALAYKSKRANRAHAEPSES